MFVYVAIYNIYLVGDSMSKFCAIDIQDSNVTILDVAKKGKLYLVSHHKSVEIDKLPKLIKNKKNLFLNIEQDEVIDEEIAIESVITNKSVIKSIISKKLRESNPKKEFIFNYHQLSKGQNEEKSLYQIDGVDAEKYLDSLGLIKNPIEIKSATICKFSLLALSNECIKEESYFSIYAQPDKITMIAVHKNSLIYSRVTTLSANDAKIKETKLVEQVTQTIAYVQQNFRDIKFSVVVLSGFLALDDAIIERIYMMSQLRVTVLYPNTFIKGLTAEEAHSFIFALGSLFVPKKFQLLPTSILGLKQYSVGSKIALALSALLAIVGFYFAYDRFVLYSDLLQEHETLIGRLNNLSTQTDIYPIEKLHKSLKYIQMSETYLAHHPIDTISSIKPLILLQKPQELQWSYKDDDLKFSATFKRQFESPKELYEFEKIFFDRFEDINTTFTKSYSVKTDYKKMDFDTTFTIENKVEKEKVEQRRRR